MAKDQDRGVVRSVERALSLLKLFDFDHKTLSLNELMAGSGLPKTTVVRLIASLETEGFLIKSPSSAGYKLGMTLFRLGNIVGADMELSVVSMPVLQELAQKTHETVEVNIFQEDARVCIAKIESDQALRHVVPVGRMLPLHRGASGKMLLAYQDETTRKRILATNAESLGKTLQEAEDELAQIRKQGYSVSQNDRVQGSSAVSAPIFDRSGKVIAGFTISGASVRFTPEKIKDIVALTREGAGRISQEMGFESRERRNG